MRNSSFSRRSFLSSAAATAALVGMPVASRRARAQSTAPREDQRFLFVVGAAGGASILDAFLPVAATESPSGSTLLCYPPELVVQPAGSNLRCLHVNDPVFVLTDSVNGFAPTFLQRHGADTVVVTQEGTSVNHLVAQKRAITGANVNRGRTIQEAMADRHGAGFVLPAVNMAESGYLEPGDDVTLPSHARSVTVADALLFPFATDGVRGIRGAPARSLVDRARSVRERLDDASVFGVTFERSPLRRAYLGARREQVPQMEANDLITKLMMVGNIPGPIPLDEYDLASSPDGARVRERFPNLLVDPLDAQGALAFLLVRYGVSCTATISPSFTPLLTGGLQNTPLAFDFSHNSHPTTQYAMWNRLFRVVDGLISLLKEQPFDENDESRGTLWDRSLVYIATDFGRSKERPADSLGYGTGHHLNNGNVLISPLLRGNAVYGGVDVNTMLTYGFDPVTGVPDLDPEKQLHEGDIYSLVAHALDIPFEGRRDFPAVVRG